MWWFYGFTLWAWIGRYFADDIFKCIFLRDKFCILIQIHSVNYVPKDLIGNYAALVQLMALWWARWQVIALNQLWPSWLTHLRITWDWFNIKMSSNRYRKSHCGDKTILRPSYLHNGTSYTGKMTSLYWIRAQVSIASTSYLRAAFICNIMFYWAYFIAELYQLSSVIADVKWRSGEWFFLCLHELKES